jgi:hypothetical protein
MRVANTDDIAAAARASTFGKDAHVVFSSSSCEILLFLQRFF